MKYGLAGLAADLAAARLFYRDVRAVVVFLPAVILVPLYMKRALARKKRDELAVQFRDGVLAAASALQAGYSVEHAWEEAAKEMESVYGAEGAITEELRVICRKLSMGQTSESAVLDLAGRSGISEIRQFGEVFSAARRTSGNLAPILRDTAESIGRRIQVKEEIRTMVSAKRLEQRMMCMMPAGILVYINLGSPGYTDPLYEGPAGRIIMSGCLLVYALAVYLGQKILAIEV